MLNVNPYDRPTAREALMDPFFKQDELVIKSLILINDSNTKSNVIQIGNPSMVGFNSLNQLD